MKLSEKENDPREKLSVLKREAARLEQAEKELKEKEGAESEALKQEAEALDKAVSDNEKSISEKQGALGSIGELPFKSWDEAEAESIRLKKQASAIQEEIAQAEEKKNAADTQVTTCRSSLETRKSGQEELVRKAVDAKAEMDRILAEQHFASLEEAEGFMKPESILKASEDEIKAYDQNVRSNADQLVKASENAEGKTRIDITALETRINEKNLRAEQISGAFNASEQRLKTNQTQKERITALRPDLQQAMKEYALTTRLYDLVKGKTKTGRITLEQFVQAAGFDGIIRAANRRLLPMSDNQFEMYRQEDSLSRRSNTFLDLEVLDNYTGRRRPVGNLSGGESFKASLSLALGLSDTVSMNNGGVQMDALFVDEGFGTLDRKSIENAMDILNGLSSANKLVGVISHREELMENIPQQILVKKEKDGSHITVDLGE